MGTKLAIIVWFILGWAGEQAVARALCRPFKFYRKVEVPQAPPDLLQEFSQEKYEASLLSNIVGKHGEKFEEIYHGWSEAAAYKRQWLACVHFYMVKDSDGDGVADWTALVDQKPSQVLIPLDQDIDGDGIENILDPSPFEADSKLVQGQLPAHLRVQKRESMWESGLLECDRPISPLQEKLYKEYGLLVINHTDAHASCVLDAFLLILEKALPPGFVRGVGNIKYLYAFVGHDDKRLIASFHRQMQAISIGGMNTYHARLTLVKKVNLIAAIAHEMGHAFLLSSFQPREVLELAVKRGGWDESSFIANANSFYNPIFFLKHQFYTETPETIHKTTALQNEKSKSWRGQNAISHYGLTNVHEWFAEAFAAHVLKSLGEKGALGGNWQKLLEMAALETSDLWTNYLNLTDELRQYFVQKLTALH